MIDASGQLTAAVMFLAAVFCLGAVVGIAMAYSEPARFRRWARRIDTTTERILDAYDKGKNA